MGEAESTISYRILQMRGVSVMLDVHLAELYQVKPSALLQAVRRNDRRFPHDFAFQLTNQEVTLLKSQFVISNPAGRGGRRHLNWAFTEQGVAMLSSVLRSDIAIQMNVEVIRAFVRVRRAAVISRRLVGLIDDLSKRVDAHDMAISALVESIRKLMDEPTSGNSRPIGFTADI